MHSSYRQPVWIGASLSALALAIAPASAQTATPVDPTGTEGAVQAEPAGQADIIVTAQRRAQRLQDVPVAVSVVSGLQLQETNVRSLADLSQRLPNVRISQSFLTALINIRGVGSGNNVGFEQSAATFVDGVYRARARSSEAALLDVAQVEVLKGPQTTFFGANAIAGALNITTRHPDGTFAYNAAANYVFETREYDINGGVTLPASDALSFRVAGRVSGMRGYVSTPQGYGPNTKNLQGRIAVRYQPDDGFTSDLRFDIGRFRTDNAFPFELIDCPPPAPFALGANSTCALAIRLRNGAAIDNSLNYHSDQLPTFANYDYNETAWTNAIDVGSGSINTITAYFDQDYRNKSNQVPMPIVSPVGNGTSGFPSQTRELYHQFSQEIRYQSETGGTFEYMIGGYFQAGKVDYRTAFGFYFNAFGGIPAVAATGTTASTPVTVRQVFEQKDRTWSGFATATIRPMPALRLNFGGRYTSVHKEARRENPYGTAIGADPATFVPLPAATQQVLSGIIRGDLGNYPRPERTDDKFMPSAGIQYDLSPNAMTYFTYSKGFKAGGYNFASLALDFGPETVDAFELGLKGSFFDRALTLNADIFRSNYRGLQETTVVFTGAAPISVVSNAARSRAQGVELGMTLRASPFVTLMADVAYLDSKYGDYRNAACTILGGATGCVSQDMTGKSRPYSPKFSGNVGANVDVPIGDDYKLSINPLLYFTSGFYFLATADPLTRQGGFAKADLRIGFGPSDGRWQVALVGKNLTDRLTTGYRQSITGTPGSTMAIPDAPRTIGLQFLIKG